VDGALAKALADTTATGRGDRGPGRRAGRLSARRLPALITTSLKLVWAAGKVELATIIMVQLLEGIGIFAVLIKGRDLLGNLIASDRGQPAPGLVVNAVIFVGANLVIGFAQAFARMRNDTLAELTAWHVRRRIMRVACAVGLAAYDDPAFHDRLQRSLTSSQLRPLQLVRSLIQLTNAAVGVVGATAALVLLQPVLAAVALTAVIPIWIASVHSGETYFKFVCKTTPADRERDYVFGLATRRETAKEIRSFALGELLQRRWEQRTAERLAQLRRTLWRRLRSTVWGGVGVTALIVLAMAILLLLLRTKVMSLAEGATAAAALLLLGQRLSEAVQGANQFFEAAPLVNDVTEFLAIEPRLREARATGPVPAGQGDIVAENVVFTYPSAGEPALRGVSIRLGAGEIVALVGENGSGKTTLAKVLCGLYSPQEGRVLCNGVDVASMDPDAYQRGIAVLFQDFIRYSLSARDNISFGDTSRDAELAEVRDAARRAGVDDYLAALPRGYDTVLGPEFEDGQDLSIGQWQRVALARAFFRDAPVVILDEPTAALDARAERDLFDGIRQLCHGRTVLLISHRFSTVRSADRIYVLDGGRVVEEGDHGRLMSMDGRYAELFRLQADAYTTEETGNPVVQ
jgi:ATP-binding cassette subfamily B protein